MKREDDVDRWRAVVERNRGADGTFVYAVKSTGVYCRPSCGARRPRRANVQFHRTPAEAERAGFRPCRRCRPRGVAPDAASAAAVARACRLIAAAAEPPPLEVLASAVGLRPGHLRRVFKRQTGLTPRAYAAGQRARRARAVLPRSRSVTAAIYAAGFSSNGRFYAAADELLGMRPSAFRRGGAGTTIRFAVGACWLGAILVAASERGVCAIALGDDPELLVRDLQRDFGGAELIGGDRGFERLVAQVVALVEQPALGLGLPLDVRGTAFQHRVWRALRKIPAGRTVTYRELAQRLGDGRAARAVAAACAANRIAVAIPCHRVVRRDGSASGYRWGVERKARLLQAEAPLRSGGGGERHIL